MAIARNLFLYCVALFWMTMTVYFFRGYGSSSSSSIAAEWKVTMRAMAELEKQNLQLKEIVQEMRSLTEPKANGHDLKEQLASFQKDLSLCKAKRNELLQANDKLESKQAQLQDTQTHSSYSGIIAVHNQIQEIAYYVHSKLNSPGMNETPPNESSMEVKNMKQDMKSRARAALIETEFMKENVRNQHTREMKVLEEMVQRRIYQIQAIRPPFSMLSWYCCSQNPEDCSTAKKIVCDLNKPCGFGCQLHYVTYCLLVSIVTNRTLILKSDGWKYAKEGWESFFISLSDTCTSSSGPQVPWKGLEENAGDLTVLLPLIGGMRGRLPHLPLRIPSQLARKLTTYHGSPSVWWVGQMVKYLLRPQPWLAETIQSYQKEIGFQHPVVGIHVRRTDKVGTEADFHSIDEYMAHVVEWYDKEDMTQQRLGKAKIPTRAVFVATDDPNVYSEAVERYPDYKFLGNPHVAKDAGVQSRYSRSGMTGVISDIILLSKCDYFVGTFSSQISRAAYEIMQTRHPDAASFAHSLDDVYYFAGQHTHLQEALYDHVAKPNSKEISFVTGDQIHTLGNHWDGYSKGINRRTKLEGLYPSYKVKEIVEDVQFPRFPGVDAGYNLTRKVF